jgi:hypothetical protein
MQLAVERLADDSLIGRREGEEVRRCGRHGASIVAELIGVNPCASCVRVEAGACQGMWRRNATSTRTRRYVSVRRCIAG